MGMRGTPRLRIQIQNQKGKNSEHSDCHMYQIFLLGYLPNLCQQ